MSVVTSIFEQGPQAVVRLFADSVGAASLAEMDVKELGDICWSEASEFVDSQPALAKGWATAALAAYEYLERSRNGGIARSARENANLLRAWPLLQEDPIAHPV